MVTRRSCLLCDCVQLMTGSISPSSVVEWPAVRMWIWPSSCTTAGPSSAAESLFHENKLSESLLIFNMFCSYNNYKRIWFWTFLFKNPWEISTTSTTVRSQVFFVILKLLQLKLSVSLQFCFISLKKKDRNSTFLNNNIDICFNIVTQMFWNMTKHIMRWFKILL